MKKASIFHVAFKANRCSLLFIPRPRGGIQNSYFPLGLRELTGLTHYSGAVQKSRLQKADGTCASHRCRRRTSPKEARSAS